MKTTERVAALMMKYPLALDTISFPVRYDEKGQSVWDSKNMMVCDVRGWSRIQFKPMPERRQDEIGYLISELLNDFAKEKFRSGIELPEISQQQLSSREETEFY